MEWIEGKPTDETTVTLGQTVAQLHRCEGTHFGLDQNNYIGLLPQKNYLSKNWVNYFRDCRLLPQIELAKQNGHMLLKRRSQLEQLMSNLHKWLPRTFLTSIHIFNS